MDEDFPYQEYKSKLKENLFQDTKFSFDFERILSQITDFKTSLLKTNNSPQKIEKISNGADINKNSTTYKNDFTTKTLLPTKKTFTKEKIEEIPKKTQNSLNSPKENQINSPIKENTHNENSSIKENPLNSPKENLSKKPITNTTDIKKYLTPPKERPINNNIFLDDTFVEQKDEIPIKNMNLTQNHRNKSLSAKNADNKVIMFMVGNEKWSRLNENSDKKHKYKQNFEKNSSTTKKKTKNNGVFDKNSTKKTEKSQRNSDLFQEKISEIQCIAEQSECLTPVKLLRELAQFKNLALEKSLTSELNSKESFMMLKSDDEKNLLKMSKKIKEKFKQDYNLDIDLIEKECKNSTMQTPSFGTNNGLQVLKQGRIVEKPQNNEKIKKMEQINEISSPKEKEEKFGHFEYVEKVYQPILKKSKEKAKN